MEALNGDDMVPYISKQTQMGCPSSMGRQTRDSLVGTNCQDKDKYCQFHGMQTILTRGDGSIASLENPLNMANNNFDARKIFYIWRWADITNTGIARSG